MCHVRSTAETLDLELANRSERESERNREIERESVCVCVCVCVRERERDLSIEALDGARALGTHELRAVEQRKRWTLHGVASRGSAVPL